MFKDIKLILEKVRKPYNSNTYSELKRVIFSYDSLSESDFKRLNQRLKPLGCEYDYVEEFNQLIDLYESILNKFNHLNVIKCELADLYYLNNDYINCRNNFFEACKEDPKHFYIQEGSLVDFLKQRGTTEDIISYYLYAIKAYLSENDDDYRESAREVYQELIKEYGKNNEFLKYQKIVNIEGL